MAGFDLPSASGWLMDQQQAFSSEKVTYSRDNMPDAEDVPVTLGETTHEQIDKTDGSLVEATSCDFVFKASQLGRTPKQGDLITRSNGEVYRVLPFGENEQCYRQRGEMLRVFTRQVQNAS